MQEILPKAGLVVSEKGSFSEVLCKPKILPLKSVTLERIQEMQVAQLPPLCLLHSSSCFCCLLQARAQRQQGTSQPVAGK